MGCSSLQSEGRELTGSRLRETWDRDRSRERGQPGLFRQAWTNSIKFTGSQLNYGPMYVDVTNTPPHVINEDMPEFEMSFDMAI